MSINTLMRNLGLTEEQARQLMEEDKVKESILKAA